MSDRRLLRSNGRVAHVSLEGDVEAERFVEGARQRVVVARTELWPGLGAGPMDRELNFGEEFTVLDRQPIVPGGATHAFGFCARDGAVGWVQDSGLDDPVVATHKVAVARSYAKMSPTLKPTEDMMPLSFGSPLAVLHETDGWSQIETEDGFPSWVPTIHLKTSDQMSEDPVAVARLFLGTPYVWGGNSAYGIDCSGLVQAALLECGIPCPADSDQQAKMPWTSPDTLKPGDLIFWKGHVVMVSGENTIIHGNAHHMAVVEEPMDSAIARIAATDTGPVTARRRPA